MTYRFKSFNFSRRSNSLIPADARPSPACWAAYLAKKQAGTATPEDDAENQLNTTLKDVLQNGFIVLSAWVGETPANTWSIPWSVVP